MEQLIEFGLFAGKAIIIMLVALIIMITMAVLIAKSKHGEKIEITHINKKFEKFALALKSACFNKKMLKAELKNLKKKSKKKSSDKKNVYLIDFDGDIKADQVESLRDEITTVLQVAQKGDEVILKLESPGGMVHTYGLAAAQLERIKNKNLKLTVCVDKVAASGGYLMACVADKILASPFAIVGSIGVLAQVPNLHKFLKKHDVDYKEYTAGEYKRTITMFGEITDKKQEKFLEQIQETHNLFKSFVSKNREKLDLEKVATGEYWYGQQAIELGLIDEIKTSDEYLLENIEKSEIYQVKIQEKKKLNEKLSEMLGSIIKSKLLFWIEEAELRKKLL
ncbi:MAG: protease SohB [Bdellovibrionales bacterium]|nr:protease SohB [Bdellovibrionales bacterium]